MNRPNTPFLRDSKLQKSKILDIVRISSELKKKKSN